MKRKKNVPVNVNQTQREMDAPAVVTPVWKGWDTAAVCVFSFLLLLAMTVQTGRMSMILTGLALLAALPLGRAPLRNLRSRLCVPLLALLALALMTGLAAIYSPFDEGAVKEYYKFLAAFALAVILLFRFEKKHVRGLLWGVAGVSAVISLLCVDSACGVGLFDAFNSLVGHLGMAFVDLEQGGNRVNGIYNDANVSAAILALGTLVALYLEDTAETVKRRLLACLLLGISAMGFFLAVSRGAIFSFALALLVWLLVTGKGNRLQLFVRMLFSAGVVLLLSIPCFKALPEGGGLPLWLTLAAGLPIFLLDWGLGTRLFALAEKHIRAAAITVSVLAALAVVYVVAALTVSGPYVLDATGRLSRTAALEPGKTYTVTGDWDGDPQISVFIMDDADMMMGSYRDVFSGPLKGAEFELPPETKQISILIDGEEGTELRSVRFSDGTELRLGYPLLPSFLAERMQSDVFMWRSIMMRVQYDKDALKLFAQSPIYGHGLSSTEGLYTAVQPFYYESLFVHNHILQVMSDMGLLGLIPFLAMLLGSAWLLLRALLKKQDVKMAAMLLACWVMMNFHSLTEINFSIRAFQCIAYVLLLMPVVLYAEAPARETVRRWGGLALAIGFWLYLAVFGALLESHRMVDREIEDFSTSSVTEFLDTLKSYVRRDVFVREQKMLTYVANAVQLNSSSYNRELRLYAEDLRKYGTYTAASGLARYYYLPRGEYEELFACSREGIAQEASSKDAWNLQLDFYRTEVLPAAGEENAEVFVDGVLALQAYLTEFSEGRLEEIELSRENQGFLQVVTSSVEQGIAPADIYPLLMLAASE